MGCSTSADGIFRPVSESGWTPTFISTPIVAGTDYSVTLVLDGDSTVQPGALSGYLDGSLFGSADGSQLWSHGGGIGIGGTNGFTILHTGGARDVQMLPLLADRQVREPRWLAQPVDYFHRVLD